MVRDATEPELSGRYVRVAQLADVQGAECVVVHVKEHTLALFSQANTSMPSTTTVPPHGLPPGPGHRPGRGS